MIRSLSIFLVLLVPLALLILLGRYTHPSSGPLDVPTPAPVTPLAPPEGIRPTLHFDPRVGQERQQLQAVGSEVQLEGSGLRLCFPAAKPQQVVEAEAVDVEAFRAGLYVQICGWREEDVAVDVTVVYPSGRVLTETVMTQEMITDKTKISAFYHLAAESLGMLGTYRFTFAGRGEADEVFSVACEIVLPAAPRIYTFQDGRAWLYGFAPDETVQVLRYDVSGRGHIEWEFGSAITETYTLVDEQVITVDGDGTKVLFGATAGENGPYGFPVSHLIALGPISGEVRMQAGVAMYVEESVRIGR